MSRTYSPTRLAVVASHPIQYYAPLFRRLAQQVDLEVFYGHRATPTDQSNAGFDVGFDWDVDLLSGYRSSFLINVAKKPGLDQFNGCDTPEISLRLLEGHFDAVLVQGWHLKSYLQAAFAAKRRRIPLLVRGDSHLLTPRSQAKRVVKMLTFPRLLRSFDAALFVGERSRAYWAHYHYPASRMFFSPHCVDGDWFKVRATEEARAKLRADQSISPATKVVLFAGKLVPFKRPLDLVRAIAELKADGMDICLLVAGAGQLEREMLARARAANVPIRMLGFCNQSAMPGVYAAADLLALPSDGCETWGMVANEAIACGCPLVLSDAVGAAPDLVADCSVGASFPVGDIQELAQAIRKTLLHPPSRRTIETKSRKYSLDAAVKGVVEAVAAIAE